MGQAHPVAVSPRNQAKLSNPANSHSKSARTTPNSKDSLKARSIPKPLARATSISLTAVFSTLSPSPTASSTIYRLPFPLVITMQSAPVKQNSMTLQARLKLPPSTRMASPTFGSLANTASTAAQSEVSPFLAGSNSLSANPMSGILLTKPLNLPLPPVQAPLTACLAWPTPVSSPAVLPG